MRIKHNEFNSMHYIYGYKAITLILVLLITMYSKAQNIQKTSLDLSIGFGLSSSYDDDNVVDDGFFFQGEYVMTLKNWLELRPYAGAVITNSGNEDLDGNPTNFTATTKAALLGGKVRLSIPIPYVAPYVEVGFGTSIGAFETISSSASIDKNGIIYHIPVALGLQLGRRRNVDLGLSYFFQPSVEQYAGAFAFGISIPLNK